MSRNIIKFHNKMIDLDLITSAECSKNIPGVWGKGEYLLLYDRNNKIIADILFKSKNEAELALNELISILSGDIKFLSTNKALECIRNAEELLKEAKNLLGITD